MPLSPEGRAAVEELVNLVRDQAFAAFDYEKFVRDHQKEIAEAISFGRLFTGQG